MGTNNSLQQQQLFGLSLGVDVRQNPPTQLSESTIIIAVWGERETREREVSLWLNCHQFWSGGVGAATTTTTAAGTTTSRPSSSYTGRRIEEEEEAGGMKCCLRRRAKRLKGFWQRRAMANGNSRAEQADRFLAGTLMRFWLGELCKKKKKKNHPR